MFGRICQWSHPKLFFKWKVFECWFNLTTSYRVSSWFIPGRLCVWVFVHSFRLSNLLVSCSQFSFIIFYLSIELAVMTLLSFLILVICVYFLLFWVNLVKVLLAFVDLFKEPTLGFPDFFYCFSILYFVYLYCNLYYFLPSAGFGVSLFFFS